MTSEVAIAPPHDVDTSIIRVMDAPPDAEVFEGADMSPRSMTRMEATARVGTHLKTVGDAAYRVGVFVQQAETLRDVMGDMRKLYAEMPEDALEKKADLLERMSRVSKTVLMAMDSLTAAQSTFDEARKKAGGARSFAPDQVVVPVQVNVTNNQQSPPATP